MKKLFICLMVLLLCATLVGCGKTNKEKSDSQEQESTIQELASDSLVNGVWVNPKMSTMDENEKVKIYRFPTGFEMEEFPLPKTQEGWNLVCQMKDYLAIIRYEDYAEINMTKKQFEEIEADRVSRANELADKILSSTNAFQDYRDVQIHTDDLRSFSVISETEMDKESYQKIEGLCCALAYMFSIEKGDITISGTGKTGEVTKNETIVLEDFEQYIVYVPEMEDYMFYAYFEALGIIQDGPSVDTYLLAFEE